MVPHVPNNFHVQWINKNHALCLVPPCSGCISLNYAETQAWAIINILTSLELETAFSCLTVAMNKWETLIFIHLHKEEEVKGSRVWQRQSLLCFPWLRNKYFYNLCNQLFCVYLKYNWIKLWILYDFMKFLWTLYLFEDGLMNQTISLSPSLSQLQTPISVLSVKAAGSVSNTTVNSTKSKHEWLATEWQI